MPLLVARQWPVLRRAPAAASALWRTRHLSHKSYAALDEVAKTIRPLDGGVIIPASVSVETSKLLHGVLPLSTKRAARKRFCVVFVTPSFAPWLFDEKALLHETLRRVYHVMLPKDGYEIDALCAVVDKLPATRPLTPGTTLDDEIARRNTDPPIAGTGFEGLAYVVLPDSASVPSERPQSSDNGSIDFIMAEHTAGDKILQDTLRLPLANTVFQTGTPTTMTLSTWKTTGVQKQLKLISKKDVSHHGIRLFDQTSDIVSALSIPLLPLTVPRPVEGCMGNIIRRLTGVDGKSVQASAELENVVPRFFKSRGQPAQATTAWALVVPSELRETISMRTDELLSGSATGNQRAQPQQDGVWERLWRSNPPAWNTLVSKALADGARLHRVLSGGGGWGQKAGLLSLDPVPVSEAMDSLLSGDLPHMISDPESFASTLTPVVRDGDAIQFFISPKSNLAEEASKFDSREKVGSLLRPKEEPQTSGWELGMIPSTMDSIPGELWQHASTQPNEVGCVLRGFGALTEGSMTLTRHVKGSGDSELVPTTTAIDVPFSRFWAVDKSGRSERIKLRDPNYSPISQRVGLKLSGQERKELRQQRSYDKRPTKNRIRPVTVHERSLIRKHFFEFSTMRPTPSDTVAAENVVHNITTSTEALDRHLNDMTEQVLGIVEHDSTQQAIARRNEALLS